VDLALWCLDFPEVSSVAGHLLNRDGSAPPAVEDYVAAQLLLANHTSVQLACSWKAPAGGDARIAMTFFGTEGGAALHNVDGSFYDFVAEEFHRDRSRRVLAEPPDDWGGRAAIAWSRQLAASAAFDPEAEHVVAVAETLDRIYGRTP
jgi:predicted dehydrogenase